MRARYPRSGAVSGSDLGGVDGSLTGSIPNANRLAALGDAVERRTELSAGHVNAGPRARGKSRSATRSARRRRRLRRAAIALGLVVVLIVGGVAADYYYLGSLIKRQVVKHLQGHGAIENILLIGSTSRCALAVQNKAYGLCSQGVNGVNSDITMILHLNSFTRTVSLLSIPRDLFVPNARIIGANKIDAALYEGPSQLVAAIEEDFAIPINHYVELNFDTFASVVNALGGVYMDFPIPVFDAESGLNIERPGCYFLNGYHALQVVRARHLQIQPTPSNHSPRTWPQELLSDLARIRRTHEFLRVLAARVKARGIGNPLTDQNLLASVLPSLTVDSGFGESEMLNLAATFAHTSIANVPQVTYPVLNVQSGPLLYQGYDYGLVEFPLQPTGVDVVDQIFGVAAGTNSFTGRPLPTPSSVKVSVENGTAVANQAATVAQGLRAKGFTVTSIGNVTPDGPVSETVVWYGGPRPPDTGNWVSPAQAAAQSVLNQLEGPAILGYNAALVTPGDLVTVQTGTGVTVKSTSSAVHASGSGTTTTKPAKSTTTSAKSTTTSAKSTTTTTTIFVPPGVQGNSQFGAPSSVNQPLQPWDPRGCTPAQQAKALTP